MKLTEYLKDKVLLLLLHMVCMAGLVIFLRLTGYSTVSYTHLTLPTN